MFSVNNKMLLTFEQIFPEIMAVISSFKFGQITFKYIVQINHGCVTGVLFIAEVQM